MTCYETRYDRYFAKFPQYINVWAIKRPVTQASKELASMRAGEITFDALVKMWAERTLEHVPGAWPGTLGFSEVRAMHHFGELTDAEYDIISRASDAHAWTIWEVEDEKPKVRHTSYYVEPSPEAPRILVRLRWPDIHDFLTERDSYWRSNRNLASWEWGSDGAIVTIDEAERIAASWGASLTDPVLPEPSRVANEVAEPGIP